MRIVIQMIASLAFILFGAELFTNAVEWLGAKLNLGQSAVGSVLAAIGTALPETAVPVTAIFLGSPQEAVDVGIGGILGAPFLLVTLGALVMAIALITTRRHSTSQYIHVPVQSFQRDMTCFLLAYAIAVLAGCFKYPWLHHVVPFFLLAIYMFFVFLTLREQTAHQAQEELNPLYFHGKARSPGTLPIVFQFLVALGLIIGGAHILTSAVETFSGWMRFPAFVVSALLIPLATELPETLNSVVWIRQGKDHLAIGNITGAMVFQSTLVPALGIWLTPWNLTGEALLTGALTLAAAAFTFGMYRMMGVLLPSILLCASTLYWILPMQTLASRYRADVVFFGFGIIVLFILILATRAGFRISRSQMH